jgi:hypothetical protein
LRHAALFEPIFVPIFPERQDAAGDGRQDACRYDGVRFSVRTTLWSIIGSGART